jgi:amino acid permease
LACGYLVTFGFAIDLPHKAAIFVAYLAYWFPNIPIYARVISLLGFLIATLAVNLFIVPIYGAVEFYLTVFKFTSIVGIIMVAVAIAAGGAPTQLLGTDANYGVVPCAQNAIKDCLSQPGFGCNNRMLLC